MFNPVAPYRYLLPNLYLSVVDIANPDLLACGSRTWISLDIARFYEEYYQPSSGSAWPACQRDVNRPPLLGREGSTQFAQGMPDRCVSSTACRLCRLEPKHTLPHLHCRHATTQCTGDFTITSTHTEARVQSRNTYNHTYICLDKTKQSHTKSRQINLHSVYSRPCII